jgi:hypothetical protein
MSNSGFIEYVNGSMLFWAVNVRSAEGYKGKFPCYQTVVTIIRLQDSNHSENQSDYSIFVWNNLPCDKLKH